MSRFFKFVKNIFTPSDDKLIDFEENMASRYMSEAKISLETADSLTGKKHMYFKKQALSLMIKSKEHLKNAENIRNNKK